MSGKAGFLAEGPEEGAGLVCLRNSQETSEAGARGDGEGGRSREIPLAHWGPRGSILRKLGSLWQWGEPL